MKTKRFKLFIGLFGLTLLILSCNKDNIGQFDDAVVESKDNPNKFKQITFVINLVNSSSKYINVNRIDSVKLKVNGIYWGTFSSEVVDSTDRTTNVVNNIKYSDSKINYLIIAPYQLKTNKLTTAGDYLRYLDDRIVLTAGDYVCEVSEIKFKNQIGQWQILRPQIYKDFKIVENTTSSYAGEISITIK